MGKQTSSNLAVILPGPIYDEIDDSFAIAVLVTSADDSMLIGVSIGNL